MFSFTLDNNYQNLYTELCSNKNFDPRSDVQISHVVCVNYMPVVTYDQNIRVYATLFRTKGDDVKLALKASYSSKAVKPGYFRSIALSLDTLKASLHAALVAWDSMSDQKLLQSSVLQDIHNTRDALQSLYTNKDLSSLCNRYLELVELVDTDFSRIEDEFTTVKDSLAAAFTKIENWISQILVVDEYIEDLFAYIEKITDSCASEIRYIPEIGAINIITKNFNELECKLMEDMQLSEDQVLFDSYMLHANYELLAYFVSRNAKSYGREDHNVFLHLNEFVPIAMKFWYVYNPLLDYHPVTRKRIWDSLGNSCQFIRNSELTTNIAKFNGQRLDVDSESYFDPKDLNTEHIGHVYYGMCSDISRIFSTIQEHAGQLFNYIVSPSKEAWVEDTIKYTPYLAEAVVLQALQRAHNLSSEYFISPSSELACKVHSVTREDNTSLLEDIVYPDAGGAISIEKCLSGNSISYSRQKAALLKAVVTSLSSRSSNLIQINAAVDRMEEALLQSNP